MVRKKCACPSHGSYASDGQDPVPVSCSDDNWCRSPARLSLTGSNAAWDWHRHARRGTSADDVLSMLGNMGSTRRQQYGKIFMLIFLLCAIMNLLIKIQSDLLNEY